MALSPGIVGMALGEAKTGSVQLYLHYSAKWQDNIVSTNSTGPDQSYAKIDFQNGWVRGPRTSLAQLPLPSLSSMWPRRFHQHRRCFASPRAHIPGTVVWLLSERTCLCAE